jgi:hypothetical protein
MKFTAILLFLLCLCLILQAQKPVTLRTLATDPEVTLLFGNYKIMFRIKDINKAMTFLPDAEKGLYGESSGLDTNKQYVVELVRGKDMQYRNALQPLLQNAVGAYLLLSGHARVVNRWGMQIKNIEYLTDQAEDMNGFYIVPITFRDAKTGKTIFIGQMDKDMYRMDLGFD